MEHFHFDITIELMDLEKLSLFGKFGEISLAEARDKDENENNQVYAYESDGSQDEYIKSNLIAISDDAAFELASYDLPDNKQIN